MGTRGRVRQLPAAPALARSATQGRRRSAIGCDLSGLSQAVEQQQAIGAYMHARDVAPYEIWLVLEHVPHVLARWLPAHPERTGDVVAQVLDTITFLRRNGIVHFDAHFGNIVTDGSTAFLTDYGLVNDGRFDLTKTERTFLERHSHYDYGAFLSQFSPWWVLRVQKMAPEQQAELNEVCSIEPGMPYPEILGRVIDHLGEVMNRQLAPVHPALAEMLQRYRDLIVYMFDFYGQLTSNPRKDTPFDNDFVRRDLTGAGVSL